MNRNEAMILLVSMMIICFFYTAISKCHSFQQLTIIIDSEICGGTKRIKTLLDDIEHAIIRKKGIERLLQLNKIQVINHRGYDRIAPENTLSAFMLSKMKGYSWIETDVRSTSDSVIVLLHDSSINRTARNADGTKITKTFFINNITYADVLNYDFGIWKSKSYRGEKIPTLKQALKLCKRIDLKMTIEIKSKDIVLADLVALVNQYGMSGRVEYLSGNKDIVSRLSRLLNNGHIGYNGACNSSLHSYLSSIRINGNIVYYHTNIYDKDATRRAVLDEIAKDGFMIVSRVYSKQAVINAPSYSTIYITDVLYPKKILYEEVLQSEYD